MRKEVESEENHDCEGEQNNEGHGYAESEQIYVIVEENGEEEVYEDCLEVAKDEEPRDTDGVYVNVQQPFAEDALDIYREIIKTFSAEFYVSENVIQKKRAILRQGKVVKKF